MNCSIILTTIFEPNDVVYKLSDLAKSSNTTLVIAGDKKTPNSFHKIDCKFYLWKSNAVYSLSLEIHYQ